MGIIIIIIELGTVGRKGMKCTIVVLEVVMECNKKYGTKISILKIAWFSEIQQSPKLCQDSEEDPDAPDFSRRKLISTNKSTSISHRQ